MTYHFKLPYISAIQMDMVLYSYLLLDPSRPNDL